jgi:hypothetical protein
METGNLNITVHGQGKKRNNDDRPETGGAKKSYISEAPANTTMDNIEVADSDEDEGMVDSQLDPFKESPNRPSAPKDEFQFKVPKSVEKPNAEEFCFTQKMGNMSRSMVPPPPVQRFCAFGPKFADFDMGATRMESTQAMWDISKKFDQTNGMGGDRANMHGIAESPRISKRNSQKDDLLAISAGSPKAIAPVLKKVDACTQTDVVEERTAAESGMPKTADQEYRPNGSIESELFEKWGKNFQVKRRKIRSILSDLQATQ